jgi:DNA-binding NarL/FixJ family response regulator
LIKKNAIQELLAALDAVMKNEMYLSPAISKVVIDGFVGDGADTKGSEVRDHLSDRERQVLTRVAEGATNKEVAQELNIAEKTVAAHRASLMRKLRLKNISDLVRFAIREGYVKLNQDDMN